MTDTVVRMASSSIATKSWLDVTYTQAMLMKQKVQMIDRKCLKIVCYLQNNSLNFYQNITPSISYNYI